MRFNGPVYEHEKDSERLTKQHLRIMNVMKDQTWRSLPEISDITGDPPASVSAQLRHLRKQRFGHHTVNKRHRTQGLWEYQLILNDKPEEEPSEALLDQTSFISERADPA